MIYHVVKFFKTRRGCAFFEVNGLTDKFKFAGFAIILGCIFFYLMNNIKNSLFTLGTFRLYFFKIERYKSKKICLLHVKQFFLLPQYCVFVLYFKIKRYLLLNEFLSWKDFRKSAMKHPCVEPWCLGSGVKWFSIILPFLLFSIYNVKKMISFFNS